jgi:hypothetical protein
LSVRRCHWQSLTSRYSTSCHLTMRSQNQNMMNVLVKQLTT